MHQSIQGKEVTFKDVLILFLKKFERIFLVAVAFAVVFAAYGGFRGYRSISGERYQQLWDDYQIKLDEYNDSTEKLSSSIEQDQQRLESKVQYTEESVYYNLDAYNEAVSELIFYVDTGYQIVPSQYYQSPNKTGEIVSAYCDAYRSAQLYDDLREILGSDLDIKYIDELLTIERAGDVQVKDSIGNVTVKHSDGNEGVIVIRARAQDEETASKITDYVFDYLKENLSDAIAPHTTTVISDSSMIMVDETLAEFQRQTDTEIEELQETIKTSEAELATLQRDMPVEPSVSMMSVIKKAILFGIIGGVLGGVIICLWVLLSYLADNRLDGAYQLAKLYNLELFAVAHTGEKKRRPLFHKLIDHIEGNAELQVFDDVAQACAYTAASIGAMAKGQKLTVALASSGDSEQMQQLAKALASCSDQTVTYQCCPSMLKNAASIETIAQADAVVLVEQSGVSLISEINREIIRLEKSEKEILGILLAE